MQKIRTTQVNRTEWSDAQWHYHYAGLAMQAFIHEVYSNNIADHGCSGVARKAWQMADAMMEASKNDIP